MTAPAWIELNGCHNTRDLAGLPATDGGTTRAGVLVRSDAPDDVTDEDIDTLLNRCCLSLVVDLRSEFERSETLPLEAAGATVLWWPLWPRDEDDGGTSGTGSKDISTDDDADEVLVAAYLHLAELFQPHAVELLEHLGQAAGATLVHCSGGKDRTGVVVSLLLLAAGVTRTAVTTDYVATDQRIDKVIEKVRARGADAGAPYGPNDVPAAWLRTRERTITRFLDVLEERHGSVEEWWTGAGATTDQLAAWRARLIAPDT